MTTFDPNAASPKDSGIFGLPYSPNDAKLILLPVPWEATTSYGGGTSLAPQCILQASKQVDLYDLDLGNFYTAGIAMLSAPDALYQWNDAAKSAARIVIDAMGLPETDIVKKNIATVNAYSQKINDYVYDTTKQWLDAGKYVGLVGGDHSSPFGAIRAFLEKYPDMGILHFDAHADLREAFEGFEYSHASIMYNVLTQLPLKKLVQVGIRDFCEEEFQMVQYHRDRITTFFDVHLAEQKFNGKKWSEMADDIVHALPQNVYISFDIDGLDPRFCPNTGTPVPGGLDLKEAFYLIKKVVQSGRRIVGFDLNEVSPGTMEKSGPPQAAHEWDANVGARLLYKLCGWTLAG